MRARQMREQQRSNREKTQAKRHNRSFKAVVGSLFHVRTNAETGANATAIESEQGSDCGPKMKWSGVEWSGRKNKRSAEQEKDNEKRKVNR